MVEVEAVLMLELKDGREEEEVLVEVEVSPAPVLLVLREVAGVSVAVGKSGLVGSVEVEWGEGESKVDVDVEATGILICGLG